MNEFDLENYESAKNFAKSIKQNADNIKEIFDKMNSAMVKLGDDWKSAGAEEVLNLYSQIQAKYPAFHNRIIADTTHILKVVETDQEADTAASNIIENA